MHIKCISNKPQDARTTEKYLGKGSGSNLSIYPLTIGKQYTVYAISRINKSEMYLILDDDQPEDVKEGYEPVWYDVNLFEVVDRTIDSTWETMRGTMWTRWRGETKSFPEFVRNGRQFYAAVLDDDPSALRVFSKYIKKYEAQK